MAVRGFQKITARFIAEKLYARVRNARARRAVLKKTKKTKNNQRRDIKKHHKNEKADAFFGVFLSTLASRQTLFII